MFTIVFLMTLVAGAAIAGLVLFAAGEAAWQAYCEAFPRKCSSNQRANDDSSLNLSGFDLPPIG